MTRYIFDFGANVGQNLDYFMTKADCVVAVEADPDLCALIRRKYSLQIEHGSLKVVNKCLVPVGTEGLVTFYRSTTSSSLSTLRPEGHKDIFEPIQIPSTTGSELINAFVTGIDEILYLKLDLEGIDHEILQEVFSKQIFPTFLSLEAKSVKALATLCLQPLYMRFKLLQCNEVDHNYYTDFFGRRRQFSSSSSGPFGEDLKGDWFTLNALIHIIILRGGFGCKDIHATLLPGPSNAKVSKSFWIRKFVLTLVGLRGRI